ncbi:MAG: hypothetical protein K8I27_16055 [Planctomycetes bacterium]|nr:hypothetical protein [Planctomycetota bacterium]
MGAEELRKQAEKKSQSGLMFMLLLAFTAALFGYGYALYHVGNGRENAEFFGLELSPFALMYAQWGTWGVVIPVVIWGAALAITRLGKTQRNIGAMLAVLLFAFAVLWPAGAVVAFMDAYDPPRTPHAPTQPE